MIKKKLFVALSLASASLLAQTPYVPFSRTLDDGGNELFSRGSLFMSSTRMTPDGEQVDFLEGEKFNMLDLQLRGSYGLTSNFQATLGLDLRYNSAVYNDGEGQEYTMSASGLRSGMVGLQYSFKPQDGLQFGLIALYETSFFSNKEFNQDEPDELALGDDGTSISAGILVSKLWGAGNFLSGQFLYRNPSPDLSNEVFSQVEAALVWKKSALVVGVENVFSLKQDPYKDDPQNKPDISRGPTYLFNSVDRSWTAPYVGLNFALGKNWRLETRVQSRVAGSSTDLGNTFSVALARRISDPQTFQKKDSAFKEYRVEASVTRLSNSGNAAIIDAGMANGLMEGGRIDFYHFDFLDGNELIASGRIVKLGATKALVKIIQVYGKRRVEEGTTAKGGLINTGP